TYLDLPKWKKYQRPKYPTPSRIPKVPGSLPERSGNVPPKIESPPPAFRDRVGDVVGVVVVDQVGVGEGCGEGAGVRVGAAEARSGGMVAGGEGQRPLAVDGGGREPEPETQRRITDLLKGADSGRRSGGWAPANGAYMNAWEMILAGLRGEIETRDF